MFGTNWDPFVSDQERARAAMGRQAQASYQQLGGQLNQQADYMQGLARGRDSLSAEQLRASLGQTMAQQRSMAASAAPQNQAMANIQASRNAMNLGSSLAGQQAQAGIQERQAAQDNLNRMLLERQRTEQENAQFGNQGGKSWWDKYGGAVTGAAKLVL